MPDTPHHRPTSTRRYRSILTAFTLLSASFAGSCAPTPAVPTAADQSGSAPTDPDNGSASAHERPVPPAPFPDRTCTWSGEPEPPVAPHTYALLLAAATPDITQLRFEGGLSPLELRFENDTLTILDGIGSATGSVQGVRPADDCWQAVAGYTLAPDPVSPLALHAVDYELRWCAATASLSVTRTATTGVGVRSLTVDVAD